MLESRSRLGDPVDSCASTMIVYSAIASRIAWGMHDTSGHLGHRDHVYRLWGESRLSAPILDLPPSLVLSTMPELPRGRRTGTGSSE